MSSNQTKKDNSGSNNTTVLDKLAVKEIKSAVPKKRQELLKWYGWGYLDSYFAYTNNEIVFNGTRYPIGGGVALPLFREFTVKNLNIDLSRPPNKPTIPKSFPVPIICDEFLSEIKSHNFDHSTEGIDRLVRSHGQTLHDIHTLRNGGFKRIPDIIVWPKCHNDVEILVKLANKYNVAMIPYGGGTSVSGAASCPQNEKRCIVILDTSQMNRMLWLDKESLVGCFEAGIIGQDLERELRKMNLTVGHEPDSYEFSSLGGWVATRASGMKKNVYGNIEDIVLRVKMVTAKGTLEKHSSAPRMSCGPDFNQVILGSEGTLGVITEVQLKVRPLPEGRKYGSLVFPNFSTGIKFMREVAKRRCQPASIRLVDNEQFKMGQTMRPGTSLFTSCMEYIKKMYLTAIKGFDMDQIVVATLLFEGDAASVAHQEKQIEEIAQKFGGISAGAKNGEKGYMLTFVIAYIRDLGLDYSIVAESFETSTTWDRCESLIRNVNQTVVKECARTGIKHYFISARVTQTYDAGCCIYFYFGFNAGDLPDPVRSFEEIEHKAREEILASGGSISHHHGVGKIRKAWYPQTISDVGVDLFKAAKRELDPKNIFAAGNLVADNESTTETNHTTYEKDKIKAKL